MALLSPIFPIAFLYMLMMFFCIYNILIILCPLSWSLLTLSIGTLSGYKINYDKSLPLNVPPDIITHFPFHISYTGFKYLGIFVTPIFDSLCHANYSPLIKRLIEDMKKWSALLTSLVGRINVVKMNILPRLLISKFALLSCSPFFLNFELPNVSLHLE